MTLVCSTSITPSDFCGSLMRPKPSFLISSPKYAIFFSPFLFHSGKFSTSLYHLLYRLINNIPDTDISRTVIFLLQEKNCVSPIITVFTPAVNLFLLQVSRQWKSCICKQKAAVALLQHDNCLLFYFFCICLFSFP